MTTNKMKTKFKVINERGTFTGNKLYQLMVESKSEFSKSYSIWENVDGEWLLFDKIERELDNQGKIIR